MTVETGIRDIPEILRARCYLLNRFVLWHYDELMILLQVIHQFGKYLGQTFLLKYLIM